MHGGHTWNTEAGGPGVQGLLYHELHLQPGRVFFSPQFLLYDFFLNTSKLERTVINSDIPSTRN